jgi:hypothetical protein
MIHKSYRWFLRDCHVAELSSLDHVPDCDDICHGIKSLIKYIFVPVDWTVNPEWSLTARLLNSHSIQWLYSQNRALASSSEVS